MQQLRLIRSNWALNGEVCRVFAPFGAILEKGYCKQIVNVEKKARAMLQHEKISVGDKVARQGSSNITKEL